MDKPEINVSIHAPAKGATIMTAVVATPFSCFNPRSREGSDDMFAVFAPA